MKFYAFHTWYKILIILFYLYRTLLKTQMEEQGGGKSQNILNLLNLLYEPF